MSLRKLLEEKGLLNDARTSEDRFFVSVYTPWFEKIARMFFDGEINLSRSDIWA
ncbi:MAG: hypothetical protein IH591_09440 [Bacteroidales bacterium]|nr:hypothetical protein [Bacteroidales bacterium]